MKRLLISIILAVLLVSSFFDANASGFTQNADAIEQATKSVLKIFVFESINDDEPVGTGSGFVAFSSLILVTNYHVIDNATALYAMDDDDQIYEIDTILCADKDTDIAILEFKDSSNLKPLDLYADDQLKRGSPVVAIGSPKGLKNTVSTGIVSAQFVEDGVPMIQTTAPISPGSSGGALLNDEGKVIGVTSSVYVTKDEYGEDTGAQNINFAVNIAVAQAMYKAWDGIKYTISNHKSSAKMDYTGVFEHSAQPAALETSASQDDGTSDDGSWTCVNCGHENTMNFCLECGAEKPHWVCACGRQNSSSKFCGECGRNRDDLINAINVALKKANDLDYAGAIEELEELGTFDSGSFETSAGTHTVAKTYIAKQYYDQGVYLQSIEGDHDQIIECFTKAGNYADAKEQIQGENARYQKAFYDAGVAQLANGEYEAAIESFTKAEDYQDAASKIVECRVSKIKQLIDLGDAADALNQYNLYKDKLDSVGTINDFVVMEPGSQGEAVKELLSMLSVVGIKSTVPTGENIYNEAYVSPVQEMEQYFGLNGDGKITFNEYAVLKDVIYPETESPRVSDVLEKLADLSYLSKLPANHSVYESKYIEGVEKAETELGLLPDGIVTSDEYDVIMEQKAKKPSVPDNLRAWAEGDTVTLFWSEVPDAICYEVFESDKSLGITDNNSFVIKGVVTGMQHKYEISAKKYTVESYRDIIKVYVFEK